MYSVCLFYNHIDSVKREVDYSGISPVVSTSIFNFLMLFSPLGISFRLKMKYDLNRAFFTCHILIFFSEEYLTREKVLINHFLNHNEEK